jgi:hypothetical protein
MIEVNKNILDVLGEDLVLRIVKLLRLKNKVATGNLIDSIEYIIGKNKGESTIKLLADYYFTYVNNGRLPGRLVPRQSLEEWMAAKGIPMEAYWPIQMKIKREGIKATYVLEEALTGLESEYAEELESLWGKEYSKEFEKIFRNNFRNSK